MTKLIASILSVGVGLPALYAMKVGVNSGDPVLVIVSVILVLAAASLVNSILVEDV